MAYNLCISFLYLVEEALFAYRVSVTFEMQSWISSDKNYRMGIKFNILSKDGTIKKLQI